MSEIVVIERPESVSYDQIHEVLWRANEVNRRLGFHQGSSDMNGDELQHHLGTRAKTWVAVLGDEIVGTISFRPIQRNTWYAKGEIANYVLAAVVPECQGMHVGTRLADTLFSYVRDAGYSLVELDTSDTNEKAIQVYKHQGFIPVSYAARKGADHYSVVMAKWLDGCPYSKRYCSIRYLIRKLLIHIRYKQGKIKRFGL